MLIALPLSVIFKGKHIIWSVCVMQFIFPPGLSRRAGRAIYRRASGSKEAHKKKIFDILTAGNALKCILSQP